MQESGLQGRTERSARSIIEVHATWIATPGRSLIVALILLLGVIPAGAAPIEFLGSCHVRHDTVWPPAADGGPAASPVPARSHLGLRRKSTQLFDVDLSVTGPNGATCAVSGVARLRGGPGQEFLMLVVRPDAGLPRPRGAALCQLYVQATASGIQINLTEEACQAQALCGGQVRLQGQRFGVESRQPAGAGGPCFSGPAVLGG